MVREKKNPEQGPLEEESLRFLLGEEIRSFHNDNFECSKEEYQIFTEVFYGKNACNTAKSRTDAGMVKYVSDQNSQSRALVSLNSGNPVPTCQPSLKDLYGRVHMGRFKKIMADDSRSSHLQEDFCGQLESDVCNLNCKQLALSSEGPSNLQMKERGCCLPDIINESVLIKSSKDVSKTNMAALDHMPPPTPYRIAESFGHGIISSCYFPSHYDERDGPNNADDNSPSRSNGSNDLIGDMKLDDEGKATTALVSWESSASKHLIENEPSALTMNKESKFFDTAVAKSSLALVRELPNRLRSHAHNLLLDAGWKIEGRRRKDRCKLYSIFKTPGEGVVIYSLIKAWRICGGWLAAGNINSSQEENSRQWLQIDGFWGDLAAVLSYIEKEVQDPKCIPSLLRRWHLLDPFMSVVFIDKKIGALREGKAVKVVRGRSVDLHLNRNSSLTEKAGLSSENQPAKVTSYSVSRSSHCRHPCKSSNICASVSSYMNHATVDEGFLTAVKPEVAETSCNRKLGCKIIPEFHTQVPHDLKEKHGSGRLHGKLSFGGEAKKRSLKSLARSLGNGSNFDRRMQNMKHMVSLDCSKQKSTSMGVPSVIRKSLTLSNTASEPSVPLILGTQKSQLESSKQDPKSMVAASTCKSFNHEVQKGVGASDSCRSLPIESQLYKEAASSQRTSNLYPKGHTVSYGKSKKCGKGVPCNGKTYATCHTLREAEQLEIQSSSVFHGSNNAVVLCLASDIKITAKNHSAYKEKNNVLEEGLNEKIVESAIALGKSASFSVESQMSDHLAEGEKVQFLYTQQAVSGDQMDAASEGATYQDTRSSVVRSKHLKGQSADATEASKSGLEQSSAAVPGSKKLSTRSRKISDIAAKKLQHKDMKSTQPSEQYEGEIVPELDDKMSDNFDFPVFQGVGNILKVGTVSCSSMTSENHEVPDRIANKMLGSVETSSAVTEISMAEKNKHEAPRTRSVKVNRTCKKRKQQDVKSESSLLNLGKDQEDRGEYQNNENKCQGENASSLEATSISSLQHIKTKKYPTIGSKSKMPVVACQKKSLVRPQSENGTLEASFLSEQKSPESQTNQRTAKRNNSGSQKENCRKRQHGEDIDDDDLLVAVIIKTKDQTSNSTHSSCNAKMSQSKGCRKLKSRKGSCKLLLRTPGKGGTQSMSGARSPLAWLLNSGVVPLNAAVQYCNPKNNAILKDGRVTREGILCQCCSKILSVSAFKCHAGHKLTQSSLNLFLESGKSYTLCQLQAWSNEYKARKDGRQVAEVEEMDQNDDTCGLCGDGGELICCDNCPSTFHQSCLHSQVIPEGSWYCPNCTCKICGDTIAAEVALGSFIMLECSQCEQKYHDICLKKKGSSNDRSVSDTWLCGGYCEKPYPLFPGPRRFSKLPWLSKLTFNITIGMRAVITKWYLQGLVIHANHYDKTYMDWAAMGALVEIWHPRTHTFLFPTFEATILLEEVELLLGLKKFKKGGKIRILQLSKTATPEEVLGSFVPSGAMKAIRTQKGINLQKLAEWVMTAFEGLASDDHRLEEIMKGFTICLAGALLFLCADNIVEENQLSAICGIWEGKRVGPAVLAYLYNGLTASSMGRPPFDCAFLLNCWIDLHLKFDHREGMPTTSRLFQQSPLYHIADVLGFGGNVANRAPWLKKREEWRAHFSTLAQDMFTHVPSCLTSCGLLTRSALDTELQLVGATEFVLYNAHRCYTQIGLPRHCFLVLSGFPLVKERELGTEGDAKSVKTIRHRGRQAFR